MSKKILHTLFALAAALILTGGFSMTAYAGGGEEYETEEPTPAPEPEETATPSDPLTPEGNATLVDDIWGENKQLITVTTKNGNYFYILIDRAAEGENTVHFLNMVDEADLMALIEDGEKEETTVMPQTCTCKEKCEAGAVNEGCPVCLNNRNSCTGTEKETEPEMLWSSIFVTRKANKSSFQVMKQSVPDKVCGIHYSCADEHDCM